MAPFEAGTSQSCVNSLKKIAKLSAVKADWLMFDGSKRMLTPTPIDPGCRHFVTQFDVSDIAAGCAMTVCHGRSVQIRYVGQKCVDANKQMLIKVLDCLLPTEAH